MVAQDGQRAVLEASFDDAAVRKNSLHLLWTRAGADIPVMRGEPQQAVAHASAHDVGVEAVFHQPVQDKIRSGRDCQQKNPPPFGKQLYYNRRNSGVQGIYV